MLGASGANAANGGSHAQTFSEVLNVSPSDEVALENNSPDVKKMAEDGEFVVVGSKKSTGPADKVMKFNASTIVGSPSVVSAAYPGSALDASNKNVYDLAPTFKVLPLVKAIIYVTAALEQSGKTSSPTVVNGQSGQRSKTDRLVGHIMASVDKIAAPGTKEIRKRAFFDHVVMACAQWTSRCQVRDAIGTTGSTACGLNKGMGVNSVSGATGQRGSDFAITRKNEKLFVANERRAFLDSVLPSALEEAAAAKESGSAGVEYSKTTAGKMTKALNVQSALASTVTTLFSGAADAGLRGYSDLSALAAATANSNLLVKRRNRSARLGKLNTALFGRMKQTSTTGLVQEAAWSHVQAIVRAAITSRTEEGTTTASARLPLKQGAVRVLASALDLTSRSTSDAASANNFIINFAIPQLKSLADEVDKLSKGEALAVYFTQPGEVFEAEYS